MSEQRKRMEDVSVLAAYDANHPEQHPYGLTLKVDHLQAREDRKRLAALLRERIHGQCCDRARATGSLRECGPCAAASVFLAEVDPK